MTLTPAAGGTAGASLGLADIDVVSNAVYADDVPFEQFARLRREAPVFRQRIPDPALVEAAWVISTQEFIRQVSLDTDSFSSNANGVRLDAQRVKEGLKVQRGNFIMLDEPDHKQQRGRVSKGFTPRTVRTFEAAFRTLAADIVTQALSGEREFDVVDRLAIHVPISAICTLLGVPEEYRGKVLEWSNAIVGMNDPESGGSREAAGAAVMEVARLALELSEAKRANPADDLLSQLANLPAEERLDDDELTGFVLLLLVAGNESTRNTTTLGIEAFAHHPDQLDWLAEDPESRMAGAVDEIIRWASPLTYMARTAVTDVEVGGQLIRAGDRVAMFYCSANRDEAVFDDPHAFRLDRENAYQHLAFGVGSHSCMGSSLARVELAAVMSEFVARVARVEIAGDVQRLQSSWVRGVKKLPIRVTLR